MSEEKKPAEVVFDAINALIKSHQDQLRSVNEKFSAAMKDLETKSKAEIDKIKSALNAEQKKVEQLKRDVQAAMADRDEWKKKTELMADHPDVIAAGLRRAEENAKNAIATVERMRKRFQQQPHQENENATETV